MRPIHKQIPTDTEGNSIIFSLYQDAKSFLINQLGNYCSFCEKHNTRSALHVEHIYPKSKYPHLENDWDNFLLACVNCNSVKNKKIIDISNIYLPHRDNLLCYIEILTGGLLQIKNGISTIEKEKIASFIQLVGLDRIPNHKNYSVADDRWENRYETYNKAERQLMKYEKGETDLENIIALAKSHGFFAVWFSIFQAHPEVKKALINAFVGTAKDAFDQNFNPIPRTQNDL